MPCKWQVQGETIYELSWNIGLQRGAGACGFEQLEKQSWNCFSGNPKGETSGDWLKMSAAWARHAACRGRMSCTGKDNFFWSNSWKTAKHTLRVKNGTHYKYGKGLNSSRCVYDFGLSGILTKCTVSTCSISSRVARSWTFQSPDAQYSRGQTCWNASNRGERGVGGVGWDSVKNPWHVSPVLSLCSHLTPLPHSPFSAIDSCGWVGGW